MTDVNPFLIPAPVAAAPPPDAGQNPFLVPSDSDEQIEISAIPGVFAKGANDIANAVAHAVPFGDRISAGMNTLPLVGSGKTYEQNLADERAQAEQGWKKNPELQMAAAAGVGAAAAGPALAAQTAAGAIGGAALGGAGYGAVQALSDTPDLTQSITQDAINTGKGAVIGGATGLALGTAGAGLGKGAEWAAGKLMPQVGDLSKTSNRLLYKAINADGGAAVDTAANALSPEANAMDVSPGATALGQGVAGKLGVDSGAITRPLTDRANLTNTRVNTDVNAAVGPAPPSAEIASADLEALKAKPSGALPGIYANAPAVDISPVIASIDAETANGAAPRGLSITNGLNDLRRSLTEPGQPIPPPTVTPLSNNPTAAEYNQWMQEVAAAKAFAANPPPIPQVPITNAQGIHRAIQDIDKDIDWTGQGVGPLGGAAKSNPAVFKALRAQLSANMRMQVPGYADSMDALSLVNRQQQGIKDGYESIARGESATNPANFQKAYGPLPQGPVAPGGAQPRTFEQTGTNTGMRAKIDTAVGTNPRDFSALKVLLQGVPDDAATGIGAGFNNRNIGHAFGQDASNALQKTVGREQAFADTNQAITGNSLTQKRLEMAKMLGEETENRPLWRGEVHNISGEGLALAPVRAVVNKIAAPFQGHVDATKIYKELAGALTSSGPARAKMIADVMQNGKNAASTADIGRAARRAALLAAAMGGSAISR